MIYGGVEAGGTKWVCAILGSDGRIRAKRSFPTTSPSATLAAATDFFAELGPVRALGIGSFGPVDLDVSSATFGCITTTPKPGWSGVDMVGAFRAALGAEVPLAFDTDVTAAAVGEARWGAGAGLDTFTYVTVGTGIGAGSIVNGKPLHGLLHPELGHIWVPRDARNDPFPGACPYHGGCLEGLASGAAMERRWGVAPEGLGPNHPGWELEADYLAAALMNLICVLSPQRIVVGGGLTREPTLLPRVRRRLPALLAGYLALPSLDDPEAITDYIVSPALGDDAGVIGAAELARRAAQRKQPVAEVRGA